ncbi:kinase-like domain-containing protein [Thermoascus aurantiacus ATCC 26904]
MSTRYPPIQLALQTEKDGKHIRLHQPAPPPELTPPVTPTIEDDAVPGSLAVDGSSKPKSPPPAPTPPDEVSGNVCDPQQLLKPLEFLQDLELRRDASGRPVEYGRGVWSVVYMATSRGTSQARSSTPPASPATANRVFAVKTPLRRDAHAVLQAEALTLTRIRCTPGQERHVVPFHGFVPSTQSIVMSAVPLTLSTYIEERAAVAREKFSTRTMFDPVLGMSQWLDLARKLIAGLSWLHNGPRVVHGDIKPHNFLLRPRATGDESNPDAFPYDPLYTDFSSAHDFSATPAFKSPGTSISALTPPFAAPELLSISTLKSPVVVPTPASDVFSLAVTLLAAATGDLLLYPGVSSMQRLAMSRDGHRVLEFVRSGANGSRAPRNGPVDLALKPAVLKEPADRITPEGWLRLIDPKSGLGPALHCSS